MLEVDLTRPLRGQIGDLAIGVRELFEASEISTSELRAAAIAAVREARGVRRSTFVPVFITNECEANCKMCGMRTSNRRMRRVSASQDQIAEQIAILKDYEGVRRIGFLTGEYSTPAKRDAARSLVGWSIRRAVDSGFEEVYFNIGSLNETEVGELCEWTDPSERVVMCVFQETYDRTVYRRFMGAPGSGPKSDFERRLQSFPAWLAAGMAHVNPGFLVGLGPLPFEIEALVRHAVELTAAGASVRLSLPRLRPALGIGTVPRIGDDTYLRLVAAVAYALPECPIVITTREDAAMQAELLPMVGIFSPGSPDVAPYRRGSEAPNDPLTSQFEIPDHRRPSEILKNASASGFEFEGWVPPAPSENCDASC